jgi:hypothetical protein
MTSIQIVAKRLTRIISVGEVLTDSGSRWKFAGRCKSKEQARRRGAGEAAAAPHSLSSSSSSFFCSRTCVFRSGNGCAVLRSSIREFLVSEAMHGLRVPTTRALSLTLSATEHSTRPWALDKDTKVQIEARLQPHALDPTPLPPFSQSSVLIQYLLDNYPPEQWVSGCVCVALHRTWPLPKLWPPAAVHCFG